MNLKGGRKLGAKGRPKTPEQVAAKFWSKVDRRGSDECWLWLRATKGKPPGYGVHQANGVRTGAHQFSYVMAHGPIPEGLLVRHKCNVSRCVNPDHLCVGTDKDNVRDAIEAGTHRAPHPGFGSDHHGSRLSEQDIPNIRSGWATGKTKTSLAKEYGVAISTISAICERRTWAHV